jgi:hypothetical protein
MGYSSRGKWEAVELGLRTLRDCRCSVPAMPGRGLRTLKISCGQEIFKKK